MSLSLDKLASVVGIAAAVGAVWARFVSLEARADVTERTMVELVSQLRATGDEIKLLQIQAASHGWMNK